MKSDAEIMAEQRQRSSSLACCPSTKSFTLGDRSTALVVCGNEQLGHSGDHIRIYTYVDGSSVTYIWRNKE